MSDFLSGENFEQMAKEYNKKYGSISVLKTSIFKKEDLEEVFSKIYLLIYMLKISFKRDNNFGMFFEIVEKMFFEMKKMEESMQISPKKDYKREKFVVNHKRVACLMIDIMMNFNKINCNNNEKLVDLQTLFLESMREFYDKI
ncbi:MAG: hypothetical protein EOM55_03790 [Clostridia bacterium]|nr:hypothetical protein [Clostridia bacterium]